MSSFMNIKAVPCSEIFHANLTLIFSVVMMNFKVLLHISNDLCHLVAKMALDASALAVLYLGGVFVHKFIKLMFTYNNLLSFLELVEI